MLHPVTGKAKFCGPCALSAVTGISSETWEDRGFNRYDDVEEELHKVGFDAVFDCPHKPVSQFRRPGVWLMFVREGRSALIPKHFIAYARRLGEIWICDNFLREPEKIIPGSGVGSIANLFRVYPPGARGKQLRYLQHIMMFGVDECYKVTKK